MSDKQTDIAAMISARICHYLINPSNAISNGVELLELSGALQSPELVLISNSVKPANAKGMFLRVVFGDAAKSGEITHYEIKGIPANTYHGLPLKIILAINTPLERIDLKLCFLMLLCIEKMRPYGGTLKVSRTNRDLRFNITG
jgi:histidine phosphotransferase ChpT